MSSPGWGYDYSRYDNDEFDDERPEEGEPPQRRDRLRIVVVAIVTVLALGSVAFLGSLAFSHPPATTAGGTTSTADPAHATPGDPSAQPTTGAPPTDPSSPTPDPTTPATKPPPAAPVQPSGNAGAEAQVLQIVNAERAKVGCKPLTVDPRLATAARRHSADMAARNYFSHTTPEGVTFDKRITAAGYRWSAAAENIAKGQRTAAEAMDAWMHSPGHRANILNCGYVNIGIGVAFAGRTGYWTQDFGTPLR